MDATHKQSVTTFGALFAFYFAWCARDRRLSSAKFSDQYFAKPNEKEFKCRIITDNLLVVHVELDSSFL